MEHGHLFATADEAKARSVEAEDEREGKTGGLRTKATRHGFRSDKSTTRQQRTEGQEVFNAHSGRC